MEDVVQFCQVRWQGNLTSCWSDPPRNLVRPDESRSQLPRLESSPNTCCWGNPEEYMITRLKFEWPPPLICIRLLSTLSRTHTVLYHLHFFSGLLQELWPKHHWLPILLPTQWSHASPTLQCLVWCHPDAGMVAIIVRELHQWQHVTPRTQVI